MIDRPFLSLFHFFSLFISIRIVNSFFSLITAKNVAADIAEKLCASVASKLEGKVLGTFSGRFFYFALINFPLKIHKQLNIIDGLQPELLIAYV